MRISVTVTDPETKISYDLDINLEQKMEETLGILMHARLIGGKYASKGVRIMSLRTGLVFPVSCTYADAGIYHGDSLRLILPGPEEGDTLEDKKEKGEKNGKK